MKTSPISFAGSIQYKDLNRLNKSFLNEMEQYTPLIQDIAKNHDITITGTSFTSIDIMMKHDQLTEENYETKPFIFDFSRNESPEAKKEVAELNYNNFTEKMKEIAAKTDSIYNILKTSIVQKPSQEEITGKNVIPFSPEAFQKAMGAMMGMILPIISGSGKAPSSANLIKDLAENADEGTKDALKEGMSEFQGAKDFRALIGSLAEELKQIPPYQIVSANPEADAKSFEEMMKKFSQLPENKRTVIFADEMENLLFPNGDPYDFDRQPGEIEEMFKTGGVDSHTALDYAKRLGNKEIIDLLLGKGVDPNKKDSLINSKTAMDFARETMRPEEFEKLLEKIDKMKKSDNQG